MPKPPTSRSAPKLSEIAREVRAPKGVVSTGWPSVEKKCRDLGIQFRPWQPDVGRLILAKRADGKYAATIGGTGLSIPRQVGKTFLVGAIVFALCLLRPRLTVIWTAHRLRTSEETFKKMLAMSKRKRIAPHMLRPVLGSGEEAIRFRNGSRILFGAREREFGRGFDEVDVLIFDEAQILTENALDAMVPATNQSRQETSALLLFMGTPPKPTDPGEVFTRMRSEALSGEDDDTGWVEFGTDPKFTPTPSPAPLTERDWQQVAKANPSFPDDTPREAILRMRKKLGPDSFLREGLGIWDEDEGGDFFDTPGAWAAGFDEGSSIDSRPALAVAVSLDRKRASIGAAGLNPAGRTHLEPIETHSIRGQWDKDEGEGLRGYEGIVAALKRLQADHSAAAVAVDAGGPAKDALVPLLEVADIPGLVFMDLEDVKTASGEMFELVEAGMHAHLDDPDLNNSVRGAVQRTIGDRFAIGRRKSGDVVAFEAATFAAWASSRANDYDPLDSVL